MQKFVKFYHFLHLVAIAATIALIGAIFFVPKVASDTTLYFNAAVDNDWNNLGNWWSDAGFSVPAGALPLASDNVMASASISTNNGAPASVSSFTITGDSISNDITITVSNLATFNNSSQNNGTIIGNAVFNNSSANSGLISADATFNNSSVNGGTVSGNATFYGNSNSYMIVEGNATFNGNSSNDGHITGNATFNDSSTFSAGTITGNATFNGDLSDNPYGSMVHGSRIRRYTSSATVTRNFTINGPWTVVVDGADVVVDMSGAIYDGTTVFNPLNTGSFVYTKAGPGSSSSSATVTTYYGNSELISATTSTTTITNAVLDSATTSILQIQSSSTPPVDHASTSDKIVNIATSSIAQGFQFTKNLYFGIISSDVVLLQKFLNASGFIVSDAGYGSPGKEVHRFGINTQTALADYQKANDIYPALGYFGPITIKFVNAILQNR